MKSNFQVLDCTLRDGGMGLQDIHAGNLSERDQLFIIERLCNAKIDMVELGRVEKTDKDQMGIAIYKSMESISKHIPNNVGYQPMYTAMYTDPDINDQDIPAWNPKLCRGVRVMLRYSELQKSLDFCTALSAKGYRVFVQPSLTMRYSDEELQRVIDAANNLNAYAVYLVDTYGYMESEDILRLFSRFDDGLNPSVRIGLHAHNNMGLAFSNVLSFLSHQSEREIIVDSCLMGMGRGGGNLQTELLTGYLNLHQNGDYVYSEILDACEVVNRYWGHPAWGYSIIDLLSALHRTAYRYTFILRDKYHLTFSEIDAVLSVMPEELRHRCTDENIAELLRISGYSNKLAGEKTNERS